MTKIAMIVALLVALTLSYVVLRDRKVEGSYAAAAALPLVGVAIAVAVLAAMVLTFRATMMAWITVLVLLAFAGNHRKVLVQRGRRITLDVAWFLVSVIFKSQKGLFALACATFVSLLATRWEFAKFRLVYGTSGWFSSASGAAGSGGPSNFVFKNINILIEGIKSSTFNPCKGHPFKLSPQEFNKSTFKPRIKNSILTAHGFTSSIRQVPVFNTQCPWSSVLKDTNFF